jgi:hypothetical protein
MIGTILGHSRIVDKIGASGVGNVYPTECMKLDREVALRFLPPERSRDPDFRRG